MKHTIKKALAACIFATAGLLGGAFAQDTGIAANSALEQIKKSGVLRVGVSPTLPPGAMRSKEGGIIGYEADVAARLAADMNVKLEHVPVVWDGLIPGLLASKFDLIISWMGMTPARNLTINFTTSYQNSAMYLVGNKQSAASLKTVEEFNKPSITLATMRGSTTTTVAQRLMPNAVIRQFEDETLMIQEVINGRAHGFLASAPRPQFEIMANPDRLFLPVAAPLVRGSEAMGMRKGDPDFLNFVNNWIYLRQQDGWLKSRYAYWFESQEWADKVAPK